MLVRLRMILSSTLVVTVILDTLETNVTLSELLLLCETSDGRFNLIVGEKR